MPPSEDPNSSQTNVLGFDEFIGILIAFATIGGILFWSFLHKNSGWNLDTLLSPSVPSTSVSPSSSVLPVPTSPVSPSPNQQAVPQALDVEPTATPYVPDYTPPLPTLPFVAPRSAVPVPVPLIPPSSSMNPLGDRPLKSGEKLPIIPPPLAFVDVPSDFWGRGFIDTLSSRGIITGFPDHTFRPNQPVSRAEFAAILQKAFDNKEIGNNAIAFKDIPENFWATQSINQSINTGFLKGYPDKNFQPYQRIPRVQVLVALVSGFNLKGTSSQDRLLSTYQDAKEIPDYATDRVSIATENGLVVNYPDPKALAPNREATRAEVAAMIYQSLVRMGRLQPIQSDYIVKESR